MIAIATLGDWLLNLAPVFSPMRSKAKTIAPCKRDFPGALSKLKIVARNSDWYIALFAPVVICRSNYFGIAFSAVI